MRKMIVAKKAAANIVIYILLSHILTSLCAHKTAT